MLFSELGGVANPAGLRLTHGGSEVALEVLADRLRFFVPAVGDRWNTTSVYWLTFNNSGPARIGTAPAAPAGSPGQAFERGLWRESRFYNSVYAGPDGDRWFYGDLQADITIPDQDAPVSPFR